MEKIFCPRDDQIFLKKGRVMKTVIFIEPVPGVPFIYIVYRNHIYIPRDTPRDTPGHPGHPGHLTRGSFATYSIFLTS